ncbi:hypothetical protein [Tenacibaculum insulae]|uniref:hypothetical protein n=1 Tax=Tenacibaculum insulae TaxID=2029677 RepID=UPI003AB27A77
MRNTLFFLILFLSINIFSQKKPPRIIFGEVIFGAAVEMRGSGGFLFGGEFNYQYKKKLFSIRYLEHLKLETDGFLFSPFTKIPIIKEKFNHKEIGLLYGKRWVSKKSSLSVSGGVSLNTYTNRTLNNNNQQVKLKNQYIGFPFELNIKCFNSIKKKYRIYGIVPVGKPTSFGRSFGFKLVGNISKNSFFGIGFIYGLGIHKKYK